MAADKGRSVRGIVDEDWTRILSAAARRGLKIGDYLVFASDYAEGAVEPEVQRERVATAPAVQVIHDGRPIGSMYECKDGDCSFRTAVLRPCPSHPTTGLRKVW